MDSFLNWFHGRRNINNSNKAMKQSVWKKSLSDSSHANGPIFSTVSPPSLFNSSKSDKPHASCHPRVVKWEEKSRSSAGCVDDCCYYDGCGYNTYGCSSYSYFPACNNYGCSPYYRPNFYVQSVQPVQIEQDPLPVQGVQAPRSQVEAVVVPSDYDFAPLEVAPVPAKNFQSVKVAPVQHQSGDTSNVYRQNRPRRHRQPSTEIKRRVCGCC